MIPAGVVSCQLVISRSKTHAFTYNHNGANQITGFTGHRVTGQGCDEASECQDDAVEDPKNNWFTYQYDDNGYPISVGDSNAESTYEHDPLGRMGRVWNSDKSDMRYGYDARGRKVRTERVIVTGKNESSTVLHTAFDGRQEFAQWLDMGTSYSEFRSLTLLPQEQQDLPYSSVLHQTLYDTSHNLLKATGAEGADIANLYIHSDKLNSSILVLDSVNTQAMRMDYSPFGQTFRKHNDETNWKLNAGINANFQLGQLMPYQFTGKYTDGNSGLVLMDARWYNPHTARFLQPDYYNLRNTNLPAEIQHELMRFTKLDTNSLLHNPMEQMAFGYVKGNPLSYVDPYGLREACGVFGPGPDTDEIEGMPEGWEYDPDGGDNGSNSGGSEATERSWFGVALDWIQGALSVVGFAPVVGEPADLLNATISVGRGDYIQAGADFASAAGPIPAGAGLRGKKVLDNLKRFKKKVPANAKENIELHDLPSGGTAVQATSPGNVPGSKAVYEKQIDAEGNTINYTKTTYDPNGNIVHVKDKMLGE